jgi:hypothetical protein
MAMMKPNPSIWQLAGGPSTRPYADVFFRHGVGLIGPGDAGPWKPQRDDDEFEGGFVRRFASEMEIGDVVLLRTGIASIIAVGIVASEYLYLNQFDEVNGWDLQHARRVQWCRLPQEYTFGGPVFGANPTRCSRTWNEEVKDYAERFLNSPPTHWREAPLPELPAEEPPLDLKTAHLEQKYLENGRNLASRPKKFAAVDHFACQRPQVSSGFSFLIRWRIFSANP